MTSIFCCLRPRKGPGVFGEPLSKEKDNSPESDQTALLEKVNLIKDEGSNLQKDLWSVCFQAKIRESSPEDYAFYQNLFQSLDNSTFDASIRELNERYSQHGLSQHAPRIRKILDGINPFSRAISDFVQADPQISALVWGSVHVLLIAAARFVGVVDDISSMLDDLAKSLPRFEAYTKILHTPRLHSALRDVYDLYINFCISTAKFLENNTCYMYIQMHWSSVDQSFQHTKHQLEIHKRNFEAEAGLANAQADVARHEEIMSKLETRWSESTINTLGEPITMGLVAQNTMFTGREEILDKMAEYLEVSSAAGLSPSKSRKSCVIHGIGGLGKSQIALEYTYRYRKAYSHIFWLRAETEALLNDGFLSILAKVGIAADGLGIDKKIELCREWLESTAHPWLLVYDNVNTAKSIYPFWPAGVRGSIIITTQNPDVTAMTTSEIELPPFSKEEGSELIRRHLRRGGSEQESAEQLSTELGGLPLAIAHFAGYVAKSQCPLNHILASFQQRVKSSQIWSVEDVASIGGYAHTLQTVWDLAFRRLSDDARLLIHIIAFLEPDYIPEVMFIGTEGETNQDQDSWKYWDAHRFNDALRILRERHLIEREGTGAGAFLKTHRALQRSILHHLDRNIAEREKIFKEALSMVRKAFPRENLARRGSPDDWPKQQKYLSHVVSVNAAVEQSDPPIANNLELAALLHDAAVFLYNWQGNHEARSLLRTAEKMCEELYLEMPDETRTLYAFCLAALGIHDQWGGIETRERSISRTKKALELQKTHVARFAPEDVSDNDWIALGRFHTDYGCSLLQAERFDEATALYEETFTAYRHAGNEDTLTVRFGLVNCLLGAAAAGQKNQAGEALWNKGLGLILKVLHADSFTSLWFRNLAGVSFFSLDLLDTSRRYHAEVLQTRVRILGVDHHETLSSKYCVAVGHQHSGDLDTAEQLLREITTHTKFAFQWTEADLARAEYRLSVVLGLQSREREAAEVAARALERRKKWEKLLGGDLNKGEGVARSQEAEMTLFDLSVCLWHGRTSGRWANRSLW